MAERQSSVKELAALFGKAATSPGGTFPPNPSKRTPKAKKKVKKSTSGSPATGEGTLEAPSSILSPAKREKEPTPSPSVGREKEDAEEPSPSKPSVQPPVEPVSGKTTPQRRHRPSKSESWIRDHDIDKAPFSPSTPLSSDKGSLASPATEGASPSSTKPGTRKKTKGVPKVFERLGGSPPSIIGIGLPGMPRPRPPTAEGQEGEKKEDETRDDDSATDGAESKAVDFVTGLMQRPQIKQTRRKPTHRRQSSM